MWIREFREKNIANDRLINLVLFVVIIGLSVGIWFSTGLYRVTVEGVTRYTPEEFYDMLGHSGIYSNTLAFFAKNSVKKKKDIPFVDDYTVTLVDKNTVFIRVYENEITGCIEIMGSYFCFDKDGFITESLSVRPEGVPKVTGLDFDEAVIFKQLNIPKHATFEVVLEITKLLKKYEIPMEEINFGNYGEVILYGKNLTVMLGKNKGYDAKLSALKGVFEKASEIGGVLDLRNYSEDKTDLVLKPFPKNEEEEMESS